MLVLLQISHLQQRIACCHLIPVAVNDIGVNQACYRVNLTRYVGHVVSQIDPLSLIIQHGPLDDGFVVQMRIIEDEGSHLSWLLTFLITCKVGLLR